MLLKFIVYISKIFEEYFLFYASILLVERCTSCETCTKKENCYPLGAISENDCYALGCLWCPSSNAYDPKCLIPYGGDK